MPQRPGSWTYAFATAAAIGLSFLASRGLGVSGHADLALTVAFIAIAVYGITPADQRDQAKRLCSMVFLALGGLIAGSAVGALFGMAIVFQAIVTPEEPREGGAALVLASSIIVGLLVHLSIFRFLWPLVRPRLPEPV